MCVCNVTCIFFYLPIYFLLLQSRGCYGEGYAKEMHQRLKVLPASGIEITVPHLFMPSPRVMISVLHRLLPRGGWLDALFKKIHEELILLLFTFQLYHTSF